MFWFELLVEGNIMPARRLEALLAEGNELLAIFAASLRTAKRGINNGKRPSSNDSMTR